MNAGRGGAALKTSERPRSKPPGTELGPEGGFHGGGLKGGGGCTCRGGSALPGKRVWVPRNPEARARHSPPGPSLLRPKPLPPRGASGPSRDLAFILPAGWQWGGGVGSLFGPRVPCGVFLPSGPSLRTRGFAAKLNSRILIPVHPGGRRLRKWASRWRKRAHFTSHPHKNHWGG